MLNLSANHSNKQQVWNIVEKEQLRQFKEKYNHIKTLTSEAQKNEIIQLKTKIYK